MIKRLNEEGGWAVLTAIAVMTVMIGFGLATLAAVDTQQAQDRRERQKEGRFNLTESVLTAQAFSLSRRWPMGSSAAQQMPAQCTGTLGAAAPTDVRCPDPAALATAFNGVDFPAGSTFTTQVRDNTLTPLSACPTGTPPATADFYDPAVTPSQAQWDSNCDGRMWVRADATTKGRTRTIVALVKTDIQIVPFPRKSVIAGKLATSNNGNKVIVDTDGYAGSAAAQPGPVSLRCSASAGTACNGANMGKGQISPPVVEYDAPGSSVLDDATLALLKDQATQAGTYYTSCPTNLSGAVVYIDSSADCSYGANGVANSAAAPGVVVQRAGRMSFGGNFTFYGVLYDLNQTNLTDTCVSTQGTSQIVGAVFVDGACGVLAGSSKENIVYDQKALSKTSVTGDGAIVRNTWRELPST